MVSSLVFSQNTDQRRVVFRLEDIPSPDIYFSPPQRLWIYFVCVALTVLFGGHILLFQPIGEIS